MAESDQIRKQWEFVRTPGAANTYGQQFIYGLATLLSMRSISAGYDFVLGHNLVGFGKPVNLYMKLNLKNFSELCLIQLKHKTKGGHFDLGKLKESNILTEYYQSYCLLEDAHKGVVETPNIELLKEAEFSTIKFVWFTNCSIEHKSKVIEKGRLSTLESMMLTGDEKEEIFSFGSDDVEVWNLRDSFGDSDRFHGFLSSLRIFSCQSHASEFPKFIMEEVKICANVRNTDAVTFCSALSLRMETWWNDENTFITQNCSQWNKLLMNDLNSELVNVLHNMPYQFKTGLIKFFNQSFEASFLNVVVPGISSSLRCLKLLPELEKYHSGRYLILDGIRALQRLDQILYVCHNSFCNFLVIDVSDWFDLESLIKDLHPDMCKIIIVSENRLKATGVTFNYQEDLWAFNQLDSESQALILEASIQFQGVQLRLKDLPYDDISEIVCERILGALIQGHNVGIGSSLQQITNTFYVPRTLCHKVTLPYNILLTKHKHDVFAVSGIPLTRPDLTTLRKVSSTVILSYSVDRAGKNYDENLDKIKYLELCGKSRKALHWVLYVDGLLVWKKSHGEEITQKSCAIRLSNKCSGATECYHEGEDGEEEWQQRLLLITGEPGMGKSTLLIRLADIMKQKYQSHWVVYVPLSNYTKSFYQLSPSSITMEDILEILCKAAEIDQSLSPNFAKRLLLDSLQHSGKILIFLDAVDEISPSYFDHVMKLIEQLLKTRLKQIWISSRTILQQHLQKKLLTLPLVLQPLSKSNQVLFLSQYFAHQEQDNYANVAERILEYTKMQRSLEERHICDVPLHAQLMANTIELQLKHCPLSDKQGEILRQLKLHNLYENFIDKKRVHFYEKYGLDMKIPALHGSIGREKDYFMDMHTQCALQVIFTDEELQELKLYNIENNTQSFFNNIQLEKTGVIDGIFEGRPKFVHLTFAEYLVARWFREKWIKTRMVSNAGDSSINRTLVSDLFHKITNILESFQSLLPISEQHRCEFEILYEQKCSQVRLFFDHMLSENFELHEAVLSRNTEWVSEIIGRGDPIDVFDNGGRQAIHLAASYNNGQSAKLLLAAGSPVMSASSCLGWTPLRFADRVRAWDVAEYLLQYGSDTCEMRLLKQRLKDRTPGYEEMLRPVFQGKIHLTRFILSLGINIDVLDGNGNTPLIAAALKGHTEIALLLLEKEADVNVSNKDGVTPLIGASAFGYLDTVRYLIFRGAHVHIPGAMGHSALIEAAIAGHTSIVDLLLRQSANINCKNDEGVTPLICAAQNRHIVTVRKLLEEGADVEVATLSGDTALIGASMNGHTDIVELLLDYDADVDHSNELGSTALIISSFNGYVDTVQALLSRGADVNHICSNGNSALIVAALNGHQEVARNLIEHRANVNFNSARSGTPLACAVANRHLQTVEILLNSEADTEITNPDDLTPLMLATMNNFPELVRVLVNHRADVNFLNEHGADALQLAAGRGYVDIVDFLISSCNILTKSRALMTASLNGHADVVRRLLHNGADANFTELNGTSPLMKAAVHGQTEVMSLLLEARADVNAVDIEGHNALIAAILGGHVDAVDILLNHGVNIDRASVSGATPLMIAGVRGKVHILKVLLNRKANIEEIDGGGDNALMHAAKVGETDIVGKLCEHGAKLNCTNRAGNTPLILAAVNGNLETVRTLLSKGVNLEMSNHNGYSALSAASLKGHSSIVSLLLDHRVPHGNGRLPLSVAAAQGHGNIVKILLDKGTDINSQNSSCTNALVASAMAGKMDIVQLLLEHSADINLRDDRGITPLMGAVRRGDPEIVRLLLRNRANINLLNNDGESALMWAVRGGSIPLVDMLLDHDAEVNHANNHGTTPLLYAAEFGSLEIVRRLLAHNADVQVIDLDEDSSLHCAALGGNDQVTKLLLDRGAKMNVNNKTGKTPLQVATDKGHVEVVNVLAQYDVSDT